MFQSNSTRVKSRIKDFFSKNQNEIYCNLIMIFIQSLILVSQIQIIPQIYEDSNDYEQQYPQTRMIMAAACGTAILLHLISFVIQKIDLRTPEIEQSLLLNNQVSPAVSKAARINEDLEGQSLDLVLTSNNIQDLVKVAFQDPGQFFNEQSELIKIHLLQLLSPALTVEEIESLKIKITESVSKQIEKITEQQGSSSKFQEFMNFSGEIIRNELYKINIPDNRDKYRVYNYSTLKSLTENQFSKCRELIQSFYKNTNSIEELKEIENIKNDSNNKYYFNTISSRIVEYIEGQGDYDLEVDKVLLNWYQTQIADNHQSPVPITFSNSNQTLPIISSNEVLSLIENRLGVSRPDSRNYECSVAQESFIPKGELYPGGITYKTIILPNRSIIDISEEIEQYTEQVSMTEVPQFQKMVMDSHKANLIFADEQELYAQIKLIKESFGFDFSSQLKLSEDSIQVNIAQITNGYNSNQDKMNIIDFRQSEKSIMTKKITIVFEILFKPLNQSIKFQVNCLTSGQVGVQECERIIEEQEVSQNVQAHSAKLQDEMQQQISQSNVSMQIWRILYILVLLCLIPCILFTLLEVNGFLSSLSLGACVSHENPYRKLISYCKNNLMKMNESQILLFCTKNQDIPQVYEKCIEQPEVQQEMCLMKDFDDLSNICQTSWANTYMSFTPEEQLTQCRKFQLDEKVSDICMTIDDVMYKICISENPGLTYQCVNYWNESQTSLTTFEQVEFCGKFSLIPSITSSCESLSTVFYTVCMLTQPSSISTPCVNFFIANQPSQSKTEKYLICNKFYDVSDIKDTCDDTINLKQHQCFREEEISDDCISWFGANWNLLPSSHQHSQCQMHQENILMGKICILVPAMVNQIQDICMTLDYDPSQTLCVVQLQKNYTSRTQEQIVEMCTKQSAMPEMVELCWKITDDLPIKLVQNPYLNNICLYTILKVTCLMDSEHLTTMNEQSNLIDIEMVGNSQIGTMLKERPNINNIEEEKQGSQFQDNYDQVDRWFDDVQMTNDFIITRGYQNFVFMSNDTGYLQQKSYNLDKKFLFGVQYGLCAISTSSLNCYHGANFQGEGTIPEEFEKESVQSGAGSSGQFQCVIKLAGNLTCWGNNSQNTLNFPDKFAEPFSTLQVWTTSYCGCAKYSDRKITCWGSNISGVRNQPSQVENGDIRVGSGSYQLNCAVIEPDGDLQCWGTNQQGSVSPPISFQTDISKVEAGQQHVCAINASGIAGCWGETSTVPDPFRNVPVLKISSGSECQCFQRRSDFQAHCQPQFGGNNQELEDKPLDIFVGGRTFYKMSTSGTVSSPTITFSLNALPEEDLENGVKLDLAIEGALVYHYSIGPNKEFCFNQQENGEFMCSSVPMPVYEPCSPSSTDLCESHIVVPQILNPVSIQVHQNLLCVIEDLICQVPSSDVTRAVCVEPADTTLVIYSISRFDDVEPASKEITQIHCGIKRFCIRQVDETVSCEGAETSGGFMENTIPTEANSGVMRVRTGDGFTCLLYRDFTTKCNGRYKNSDGTPVLFSIHDEPQPQPAEGLDP